MKKKKIYKGEKLIAEHLKLGWIVYDSCERKWINSYIKRHKDNIEECDSLKGLMRRCIFEDFVCLFKRK